MPCLPVSRPLRRAPLPDLHQISSKDLLRTMSIETSFFSCETSFCSEIELQRTRSSLGELDVLGALIRCRTSLVQKHGWMDHHLVPPLVSLADMTRSFSCLSVRLKKSASKLEGVMFLHLSRSSQCSSVQDFAPTGDSKAKNDPSNEA